MREDIERIASKFLRDGLSIRTGDMTVVNLVPYLADDEIKSGIAKLFTNKKQLNQLTHNLRLSRRVLPFGELWPGMKQVIKSLEKQDARACFELVLPTINGAFQIIERVRDILREQYRADLFPKRFSNPDYPGIRLANTLTSVLKRFPKHDDGLRIHRTSDLKVLASNALISLHIVKTAAVITKKPQFIEYYKENLYAQDELLKTALDWHGMEDELTGLIGGNSAADTERRGYLGTLAAINLYSLEQNPTIKESYRQIIEKEWSAYKNEDNPMMSAFTLVATKGKAGNRAEVLRALGQFPENPTGFGRNYWQQHGRSIADKWGGGEKDDFSREPLPVALRPRDSFLWQRNGRRLDGDFEREYPGTDYLFVYWYGRAHNLLPDMPPETTAQR